jgi:hypothetical protein
METNYQVPNLPNITPLVMENEKNLSETKENEKKRRKEGVDQKDDYKKNYLNVKLEKGQKEKTLTIRLLPMDLDPQSKNYGTPFVHVYVHNVKVPKELNESGYKNYICLSKTDGIDHDKFGYKCPFCEINKAAYNEGKNEKDPVKQKELFTLSTSNLAREAVIVRCIDRDHEDEGVKFWKFNLRDDKTDPYNQIMDLWNLRMEEGKRAGINLNILDIYNGVDLTVKITEGNSAPTITDGRIQCPISRDSQQLHDWLYDKKTWQEVFTAKPYEYLKLISAMKIPWKDKESGLWVDKEEYMNSSKEIKRNQENQISEAEAKLLAQGQDLVDSLTIDDSEIPM